MILLALLRHYFRRYRVLFLAVCVLLFLLEVLYVYVFQFWREQHSLADILVTSIPDPVKEGIGIPLGSLTDPRTYQAIVMLKPDFRLLFLLFGVVIATDVIAGEVGRGTAELLFSHPVRRRTAVVAGVSAVAIHLVCLALVFLFAFGVGTALFPMGENVPTVGQLVPSIVDIVLTSFVIVLTSFLVGSLCATRARAVGWSLLLILAPVVLVFLSVFTQVLGPVVRILPEYYYRPHAILFGMADPSFATCVVALGIIGVVAFGGAIWFAERRDLTRQ